MDNSKYMYCPYCGKHVLQSNRFCPFCGKPLHQNAGTGMSQPEDAVRQDVTDQQTAVAQPSGSSQTVSNSSNPQNSRQGLTKHFSASALLFWVKGYVSESDSGVDVQVPNTVCFGLIPAGSQHQHFTLKSINSPGINTQYSVKDFIIGAVLALIGIPTLAMGIGIIFLLLGIGIFCNGIITDFTLEDNAGELVIPVPFYNRQDIEMLVDDLRQRVEEVQNRRDQSRNLGNYFQQR